MPRKKEKDLTTPSVSEQAVFSGGVSPDPQSVREETRSDNQVNINTSALGIHTKPRFTTWLIKNKFSEVVRSTIIIGLTPLTVIFTALIVYISTEQIKIVKDSAESTKKAAEASQRSVEISQNALEYAARRDSLSSESFRLENRAYVLLNQLVALQFEVGKPVKVGAEFHNTGRTPAIKLTATITGKFLQDEGFPFTTPPYERGQIIGHATLGPNSLMSISPDEKNPLSKSTYDAVVGHTAYLFVYGVIEYDDIFGGHHITQFCGRYDGRNTPVGLQACDQYNDIR